MAAYALVPEDWQDVTVKGELCWGVGGEQADGAWERQKNRWRILAGNGSHGSVE